MAAYYNEFDPQAAQWLRNLIAAGHIAPGDVDERSIEDVTPDDLRGYAQCHFFAGIGVWSYALRRAGWPDDRPVWTGSCPCQPFSSAGAQAGFADERHLWPAFQWLIAERRPPVVFGEQVASKAVEPWVDLVHADLEALGYAFGGVPFPSAGVGAPHIRDRLYWVADSDGARSFPSPLAGVHRGEDGAGSWHGELERPSSVGGVADSRGDRLQGGVSGWSDSQREALDGSSGRLRTAWGLADAHGLRCEPAPGAGLRPNAEHDSESLGGAVRLGYAGQQPGQRDAGGFPGAQASEHGARLSVDGGVPQRSEYAGAGVGPGPGPVNGRWRAADWLCCRDGKWRPVEPGTFPLADGAPSRVVRLRAYGNAINAEAAVEFICAYEEARTRVGRVPEPDLDDEFLGLI